MKFDRASLWVQLYQLPLNVMHRIVGEMVKNSLGTVKKVEVEEDNLGWGKKLRVRVVMDLTKPLARGRKITLLGERF